MRLPDTLAECHDEIALLRADVEMLRVESRHQREEIEVLQDELGGVKTDRDYQEGEILDLQRALDEAYRADDKDEPKEEAFRYDPAED